MNAKSTVENKKTKDTSRQQKLRILLKPNKKGETRKGKGEYICT